MSSPYINHFLQPDTLIPDPSNPQAWNRYSYTLNNPVRYNDPTGHKVCEGDADGFDTCNAYKSVDDELLQFGIRLSKTGWDHRKSKKAVLLAAQLVGARFASTRGLGESAGSAFKAIYGHITIKAENAGMCGNVSVDSGGCTNSQHHITFWSMSGNGQNDIARMTKNVVHEFGHAYNASIGYAASIDLDQNYPDLRADRSLYMRPNPGHPKYYDWQQHPPEMDDDGWSGTETFGDMFIAWTYNAWNTSSAVENINSVRAAQTFLNGYGLPSP